MIVKVIGRKGFSAIEKSIRYVCSDHGNIADHREVSLYHNCRDTDVEGLVTEFENHYDRYAVKRKGRNSLQHIILSYSPADREKMDLDMMDDLARTYIQQAIPHSKSFAVHHTSKDVGHLHTHIVCAANQYRDRKAVWFSKKELMENLRFMQQYQLGRYPELEQSQVNMKCYGQKLHSEPAYYKKKRNNIELEIERLEHVVKHLFRTSASSQDFLSKLNEKGLMTYQYRNKTNGVLLGNGRKIRFNRLGVSRSDIKSLDKQDRRLKELEKIRGLEAASSKEHEVEMER